MHGAISHRRPADHRPRLGFRSSPCEMSRSSGWKPRTDIQTNSNTLPLTQPESKNRRRLPDRRLQMRGDRGQAVVPVAGRQQCVTSGRALVPGRSILPRSHPEPA
jgi:hypothetical protein